MQPDIVGLITEKSILFQTLGQSQAKVLLSTGMPVHYPARKMIFATSEPGDTMLLIETGRVEISLTSESGRRSILAQLGPEDVVGEMAVLDGQSRSADALAATDVTGCILTRAHVMSFLKRNPDTALAVISALCQRLRVTNQSLADHVLADGRTRLARLLLRLMETWGKPDANGHRHMSTGFSQSDLGDMSGLTRETVNRLVRGWEKDKVLRRGDESLVLLDVDTLIADADIYPS